MSGQDIGQGPGRDRAALTGRNTGARWNIGASRNTGTSRDTRTCGRRARGVSAALAGCMIVAVLSGCTSGGGVNGSPPTSPSPSGSRSSGSAVDGAQIPNESPGVVAATAVPTDVPNDPDLRKDVTVRSCHASDDGWTAEGVVANGGDAERRYVVSMFFTDSASTVVGDGTTEVTVAAGARRTWKVTARFTAPDPTLCVLRGVGTPG